MKNFFNCLLVTILLINISYSQSPANPKNSFDYIGEIHNEILIEFMKQNQSSNMSIEEILNKIKPITLKNEKYFLKFGNSYSSITVEEVKKYMPDIANNFNKVVDDKKISVEAKTYLKELLNDLSGATEFSKVYQNVLAFENRVIQSGLSSSEKELVLSSSSIARYSSYLWLVEKPKPVYNNSLSSRFRWWSIVADMAGGVLGSAGGPAGIVAGAAGASAVSEAISHK